MKKIILLLSIFFFIVIYFIYYDSPFKNSFYDKKTNYEKQIHFNSNSYRISKNSKILLDKIGKELVEIEIKFLKKGKSIQILVEGYTDNVGDKKYNQALSYNRSVSVVNYLKNNFGFRLKKMIPRGMGSNNFESKVESSNIQKNKFSNNRVRIITTLSENREK